MNEKQLDIMAKSIEKIFSDAFEKNELKINKYRKKKYIPKNKK